MRYLKATFICFCICLAQNLSAQPSSKDLHDSVATLVQTAYNSGDPSNVYFLTSPGYREKMSRGNFITGTKKFFINAGRWISFRYQNETEDGFVYTARFERGDHTLLLKLNKEGKIVRFSFKPLPYKRSLKNNVVISDNRMLSGTDSLVEQLVRPYIQQAHTSGISIAVLKGKDVYRYNYGEVKRGGGSLPNPETTVFEIGSVTKTFTSLLLANQVLSKTVNLDEPINKFLPDSIPLLAFDGRIITLQNLANHTSGFPRLPDNIYFGNVNPVDPYQHYVVDSLYSFLKNFRCNVRPGSSYSYSNVGAGLLGTILSTITAQSFDRLIAKQVCQPLKMTNTFVIGDKSSLENVAQGYNEKGEPTTLWHLASLQGSGAILSTMNDMIRYTQAQLGQVDNPLKKAIELTHRVTFNSTSNSVGLGWRIDTLKETQYLHHSGGTGGFRSFVGFDKKRQLGVIILSNTAEDVNQIGQSILE